MNLYLPIKSEFLEQIKSGVKLIEYRPFTKYWINRLKNKKYTAALFHQYRGVLLVKKILIIKKIRTPKFIKLFKSEYCFAIYLSNK